jgi:CheY-like chemotaxis protein
MLGSHKVDAILMDLRMPVMSGQTLFHVILSQWPPMAARIAVMSGDPEAEEEQEWLALYRLPVIAKPFELSRVFDMVERLCVEAERRQAHSS